MLVFSWALLTLSLVLVAKAEVKKEKKKKRERARGFKPDQYKKHIYIFLTDYSAIYTVKHTKQYTIFKFLKLLEYAVFNMHVCLMIF